MVTDSVSASGLWVLSRSSRHRDPVAECIRRARHRLDPPRLSGLYNHLQRAAPAACSLVLRRLLSSIPDTPRACQRLPSRAPDTKSSCWSDHRHSPGRRPAPSLPTHRRLTFTGAILSPGGQGALAVIRSPFRGPNIGRGPRPHLADRRAPRRLESDQQISSC